MGWRYGIDGDRMNDNWHHTIDGDYEPIGMSYTLDGDLQFPNGKITDRKTLEAIRKGIVPDFSKH